MNLMKVFGPTRDPDTSAGSVAGAEGTSSAYLFRSLDATPTSFEKTTPAGYVQLAVCMRAHSGVILKDSQLVLSGEVPLGAVNLEMPGEQIAAKTTGPWEMLVFFTHADVLTRTCMRAGLPLDGNRLEFISPRFRTDRAIHNMAVRAVREISGPSAFAALSTDLITQDIAIHLLRTYSNLANTFQHDFVKGGPLGLADWQLKRAFEAMSELGEGSVTLSALAAAAACSPTHFSRAFKQSTGFAPFNWLLRRRIDRAMDLLRQERLSLAEVALRVGFAAQPQFTTAFKRVTGTTPGAWRRKNLR